MSVMRWFSLDAHRLLVFSLVSGMAVIFLVYFHPRVGCCCHGATFCSSPCVIIMERNRCFQFCFRSGRSCVGPAFRMLPCTIILAIIRFSVSATIWVQLGLGNSRYVFIHFHYRDSKTDYRNVVVSFFALNHVVVDNRMVLS